jgi:hypothetical protein
MHLNQLKVIAGWLLVKPEHRQWPLGARLYAASLEISREFL